MEYEFYIDLFFFTDFFLNFLSLLLTAAFLKERLRFGRCVLAAVLGSLWNCFLVVFPVFPALLELGLTVFLTGSLMVKISFSFGISSWRQSVGAVFVLLISSALLSGCLMFSRQHFYLSDWESLFFVGAVSLMGFRALRASFQTKAIGKVLYPVRLYYRGKEKEFLALADSGNRLHVPGTGKPVSLISYWDCKGFCDSVSGGFYIPYRAVGTEKGVLFAVLFEKMEILKDGKYIMIENPAVAITKERISVNGEFSILLPEEYVL